MTVFESRDYRAYLHQRLDREGPRSGERKAFAEHIQVHTTYVSQVLTAKADLSLEQAELANQFFSHSEAESEYFLNLVLKSRAGLPRLKARFEDKLEKLRQEHTQISQRLNVKDQITPEARERFYSSPLYGAIHVLSSVPAYRSIEALAEVLRLDRARVADMVEFLLSIGILKRDRDQLQPGSQSVHLKNDTELILKHHTNWRLHTLNNLQFLDRNDVHYSGALSLSEQDVQRVKELLLDALKGTIDIVKATDPERVFVLNFDFYRMDRKGGD